MAENHSTVKLRKPRQPYRHAFVNGVSKLVHVIVAEAALGKSLPQGAVIHHVDGNNQNNSPSNLVICQDQAYHMLLHARQRVYDAGGDPNTQKICTACKAVKSQSCFGRDHDTWDLLRNTCGPCRSIARARLRATSCE